MRHRKMADEIIREVWRIKDEIALVTEHQRSLVAARARRLERSAIIKAAECGMVRRQVTATIQRPTDPLVRPGATKTSN